MEILIVTSANRLQKQSKKKEENNQSHEAISDITNLVTRSIRSSITVKLGKYCLEDTRKTKILDARNAEALQQKFITRSLFKAQTDGTADLTTAIWNSCALTATTKSIIDL